MLVHLFYPDTLDASCTPCTLRTHCTCLSFSLGCNVQNKTQPNPKLMAAFASLCKSCMMLHPNGAFPPKRFAQGLEACADVVVLPKTRTLVTLASEITGHLRSFLGMFREVGFKADKWQRCNSTVYLLDI